MWGFNLPRMLGFQELHGMRGRDYKLLPVDGNQNELWSLEWSKSCMNKLINKCELLKVIILFTCFTYAVIVKCFMYEWLAQKESK